MIALNRSGRTMVIGVATGLALGALTNMGLLPLGGLMSLLGGGAIGGPQIMGEATEANFETYEVPSAMAALYNNAGHDKAGYQGAYLQAYAIKVADAIRQACGPSSAFTTAEIKTMENRVISQTLANVTPEAGLNIFMNQLKMMAEVSQDARNLQKYVPEYDPQQIPMTGQADGYRFSQEYGCEGGTMNRFAKNLRSFMNQSRDSGPKM